METDTRFEVIGEAVLGFGLWFAFRGMGRDVGGGVVVVVYSRMSCEFVRTGEALLAGWKGADKRFFACVSTNVTGLKRRDRQREGEREGRDGPDVRVC